MIWTILKIVVFLLVVGGLAFGIETLIDQDAGMRIALGGMEFSLGPLQMAFALILMLAALWLILKLSGLLVATLRFINGDDNALSRYFARNREKRGLEAATDGLIALASGDGDTALARARKAEKLMDNPTLTNLLVAQSAQTKGNSALAEEYYKRLLDDERSRFVGVRGLAEQKLLAGEDDKARKLAETALSLRPGHAETQDTLLGLQNKAGDWKGARRTLLETSRAGRLPRPVYQRRDAVLSLQQATTEAEAGNTERAQELAIDANRAAPDLVPAAVMASSALNARGKKRAASKALIRAWKAMPHPELAHAFAALEPDETPAKRMRRFEKLMANGTDAEAKQTRAELLIAAEDFPGARRALGDLHETMPTQRVLTIMAAIERGEGSDDQVVRGWLARALTASRGPQWVCDKCQHVHASWHAICDHCGSFDTLSWKTAPDSSGPSATGTEMLPLIVGALPPAESTDTVEAEVADEVETPPSDAPANDAPESAPDTGLSDESEITDERPDDATQR